MVNRTVYQESLAELKELADSIPNTPMLALGKIHVLVALNMRYEKIKNIRDLDDHPYLVTRGFVQDAIAHLKSWVDMAYIEATTELFPKEERSLEDGHKDLFQKLWINFDEGQYQERIETYKIRLSVNCIDESYLKNKTCIDFGCGHGNFAHALLAFGAREVFGIDFGENSIKYAIAAKNRLNVPDSKLRFQIGSVYDIPKPDSCFDFGIQNGVFHHLDNETDAYREAHRVLKPGAYLWVYTDGGGGIAADIWDVSRAILEHIPEDIVLSELKHLNINTNKRYHLGDGLKAVYRRTTWHEITTRLKSYGFGNFKRLKGGLPYDYGYDVIAADKWGGEKFGEGDLRLLCQKMP